MKQLKSSEIKQLREELWEKNNHKCPLCENKIDKDELALDHCHVSGQIRNTLCKICNSLEGAMKSKWKRSGASTRVPFEVYLYNLSQYLDTDTYLPILHPTHGPGPKKLMKSSYNELVREIKKTNAFLQKPIKVPPYPKSKRLTKRLAELYEKMAIIPRYYTR